MLPCPGKGEGKDEGLAIDSKHLIRRNGMNMKRLAMGLALGLVIGAAIGRAEADTISFQFNASESFITSEIDTNGDGQNAGLGMGVAVDDELGKFTFQELSEFSLPVLPTGACPIGQAEFPLLLHRAFLNHIETGDQLFSQITSGTLCSDSSTFTFSFSVAGIFTGGTGQFAGATGSFTANGSGAQAVFTPGPPGRGFGRTTGTTSGTLVIPDDD
jgi:hypothetical protein